MTIYLLMLIALLLLAGCYAAVLWAQAKYEVQNQPREAMYECPKHGIFRKKHLLTMNFGGDLTHEVCPMCFSERAGNTKLDGMV